jgi:uncharacterized damage-inducible protein DinB
MTQAVFTQLAAYNSWANARLYGAALDLPDEAYRQNTGVFFGSLHRTLNHLLVADRIWMQRLTGEGTAPTRLDALLYDALPDLARARMAQDARLEAFVSQMSEADSELVVGYRTIGGQAQQQPLTDILLHLFNHQTHHRGQAHASLSIVTSKEPPSLDLLQFQRGVPAPDLATRIA